MTFGRLPVDVSNTWRRGGSDGQALKTCSGLHQGTDDSAGVEAAQVVVGLTRAHKHNGLPCDVSHGDGSAHLQDGEDEEDLSAAPFLICSKEVKGATR